MVAAARAATVEVARTMAATIRAATIVVAVGRSTMVMATTVTMTVAAAVLLVDHDQLRLLFVVVVVGWCVCLLGQFIMNWAFCVKINLVKYARDFLYMYVCV